MQRRVDGADRHWGATHGLEDAVEILPLQRQQLIECRPAVSLVVGEDHLLHDGNASFAEEHVLGAAEPDPASAKRVGDIRLVWQVGIGANPHSAERIRPLEEPVEALIDIRRLGRQRTLDHLENLARLGGHARNLHLAREPVKRDEIAFLDGVTGDTELLGRLVDIERAGANDGGLPHLSADDGRVGRHAAGRRQDAL